MAEDPFVVVAAGRSSYLKPGGRIALIDQEFDDPIAKQWDLEKDRIKKEQLDAWMANVGFELVAEYAIFKGMNNPPGAGMPGRWYVLYRRRSASASTGE